MLQKIQTRLEIKILLLIVLVLIIGFGTYVVLSIQNESQQLLEGKKRLLRGASATLMAGIRNVMLTGKAPFAIEMVNDVRQNVKFVDVTIYDRFGREVFLREGEGTNTSATDSTVNNVLATHAAHAAVEGSGTGRICTKYDLVLNHPECFRCHDKSESVRGVLHTALRPSALDLSLGISPERAAARAMGATIAAAFRTLMLGGNGGQMD
ncbi:MAG: hypothetical protein HY966_06535, partial [Ignavibacteriales bacterium]|nr:hypothetical protein [Ignavibacteriales bacterium]